MSMLEIAKGISKKAHAGQVDKSGKDYFQHPETVASLVSTEIEKVVAYLHDVIEDTSITSQDLLNAGISAEAVNAIQIITKQKGQDYLEYLAKVKQNEIARKVKLADLTHNSDLSRLAFISEEDLNRTKKYQEAMSFLND